jgi:putative flippase GtrA
VYRLLRQLLLDPEKFRMAVTHAISYMSAGFAGVPINMGIFAATAHLLSDGPAVFIASTSAGAVVFLLMGRFAFPHEKCKRAVVMYVLFAVGSLLFAALNMSVVLLAQHLGASHWGSYFAGMCASGPCNYSWNRWVVFRKPRASESQQPTTELVERSETTSPH